MPIPIHMMDPLLIFTAAVEVSSIAYSRQYGGDSVVTNMAVLAALSETVSLRDLEAAIDAEEQLGPQRIGELAAQFVLWFFKDRYDKREGDEVPQWIARWKARLEQEDYDL